MNNKKRKILFYCVSSGYFLLVNSLCVFYKEDFKYFDVIFVNALMFFSFYNIYAYLFDKTMYVHSAILYSGEHKMSRKVSVLLEIALALLALVYSLGYLAK